jgi:hypothetical protein
VRQTVENVPFGHWDASHPAAAGLRAKDFKLAKASVFEAAPGDGIIGEVAAGPVIAARPGKPKIVVLGFHPALTALRYELASPLLFANLLRWMSPELFRHSEVAGGSVGTVKLLVEEGVSAKEVNVTADDGSPVPFTVRDHTLDFFAGRPGAVRVQAGNQEYLYSLRLPQLGDSKWEPPAGTRRGIPRFTDAVDPVSDVWPWLALAGGAGLLAEWLLYGRFRVARLTAPRAVAR